ncbi:MAG: hypothetical protein AB2L11_04450 [Syntrophobacteraceae bacterium]
MSIGVAASIPGRHNARRKAVLKLRYRETVRMDYYGIGLSRKGEKTNDE